MSPLAVLGWAIAIAAALTALARARPRLGALKPAVWDALGLIAVAALAAWVLWPAPAGRMPTSQDHPVHLFRAWHFVDELLARGRLSGWSDYWFAGWPAGDDYPPGADIWMALWRALTWFAAWETTYAIGLFAVYLVTALAAWRLARPWGPVAALVAAALIVTDRGEYREGGFAYSVFWGVWPQQLSTAFLLLGLPPLQRLCAGGRPRDLSAAALSFGASLLCHPMTLIVAAVAFPIWCGARVACAGDPPWRTAGRTAAAWALAWALSALFTLPFSARAAWMASYGDLWRPLGWIAEHLARGDVFAHTAPAAVWLGLGGLAAGAFRRDARAVFLGVLALALLAVASSTFFRALSLGELSDKFGQVQWQRLAAPAKAALLCSAGLGAQAALDALTAPAPRRWIARLACAAALAPFAAWAAPRARPYLPDRVHTDDGGPAMRAFLRWSAAERARSPDFYRIAYLAPYNDHSFSAAPVHNRTPAYKVGFTPASNFLHKPDAPDPDLYRTLSVRFLVSRGPRPGPDLVPAERFGPIHVYRFARYTPRRFTLLGAGEARAARFAPEHIVLDLSGTAADTRAVLHVAHHPRWRATLDGREVPLATATLADEPIFLSAPAHGRRLELRYARAPVDWTAPLLSLAALGLCGWLAAGAPRLPPRARRRWPAIERRAVPWAAAALGAALAAAAAVRAARSGPRPSWTARAALDGAAVELERAGAVEPCPWSGDRFRCSAASWNHVGRARVRAGGVERECLWAHPVAGGELRVRFSGLRLGRRLVLRHGLADGAVDAHRHGAPVRVAVRAGGREVGRDVRPNRKGWAALELDTAADAGRTHDVEVAVTADRAGGRHWCFDLEVYP